MCICNPCCMFAGKWMGPAEFAKMVNKNSFYSKNHQIHLILFVLAGIWCASMTFCRTFQSRFFASTSLTHTTSLTGTSRLFSSTDIPRWTYAWCLYIIRVTSSRVSTSTCWRAGKQTFLMSTSCSDVKCFFLIPLAVYNLYLVDDSFFLVSSILQGNSFASVFVLSTSWMRTPTVSNSVNSN